MVLRVEDNNVIDPRVLFTFLRSKLGQLLLKQIVSGAAVPLIQLRELEKISIPIPPRDEQEMIIRAFEDNSHAENKIAELRAEQAERNALIWQI